MIEGELGALLLWFGALAAASVLAGFVAGLLGVGGGIVTVPVMFNLFALMGLPPDLTMQIAVGTSLATIVPTGIMSARSHLRRGSVDRDLLRAWVPFVLAGTLLAVLIARWVDGRVLMVVFAVVALAVAADMFLRGDRTEVARGFPNEPAKRATGFGIGTVSTLMGIGGGTLSVPILSALGYPIRLAVGTAAAVGVVIAIPGAIGFVVNGIGIDGRPPFSLGYVNLIAFATLLPAALLMPPLGARVAHLIPPRALRLCFGAFLLLTSLRMFHALLAG
jgi:uncharacterized protein